VWKELHHFTIHSQGEHGQLNEMDFNFHNNKVPLSMRLCTFNIQDEFVTSIYREILRTFNNTCHSSYFGKIGSATEIQIQVHSKQWPYISFNSQPDIW
jgi:hypothetical protein